MPIEYFREIGGVSAMFRIKLLISILLVAVFSAMSGKAPADGTSEQAKTLYSAAVKYEDEKQYQKAKETYAQVVQQFPTDSYASDAQMSIPKIDILFAIETGKDKNVQPMIDKFIVDFSTQPHCYQALSDIAKRFEGAKNFVKAKEIYQQIVDRFPTCSYYDTARVCAARSGILNLIESGDDAQIAIDKLLVDFGQSPGLARALYYIADRYERTGKYDKAVSAYQQVIVKCPGSTYANDAQLDVQKITILSLIEAGNDAQAQVDKLCNDFSQNTALPAALYRIAERYEGAKKPVFDENALIIYQKIAQAYPGSDYAVRAALNAAKMDAVKTIMAGTDANSLVERMVSDFSGNAGLPEALYCIARRYEEVKKLDKAWDAYRLISERFPESAYSGRALLLGSAANIQHIIQSQGATAEAQAQTDKLISDFAGDSRLAEVLYYIAQRYRNSPKPDYVKAATLYQKVIADYPSTGYAEMAKVYSAAADVMGMIDSFADDEPNGAGRQAAMSMINASLADMKTAYAANPEFCRAMLGVAEKSYVRGMSRMRQDPEPQNVLLLLCRDTIENNIIGKTSEKGFEAETCYVAGLSYDKLGEYAEAAGAFEAAYQADPKHIYAYYLLFAQGRCYENLLAQKLISEIDAKAIIKAQYSLLISKYPQSAYAPHARFWLENNSK